jgi:hypothetical protein
LLVLSFYILSGRDRMTQWYPMPANRRTGANVSMKSKEKYNLFT